MKNTEYNMTGNARQFQESITQELDIVRNRVRNLIGDAHWGEEGQYKEIILRNVIKKKLSNNLSIGTGFILKNNGLISNQLDIIIYDNTTPLLFSEGDFIITTPLNVRGIVEVKSKITASNIRKVVKDFDKSIKNFILDFQQLNKIFMGVFAFEFDEKILESNILDNILKDSGKIINHISLGTKYFVRHWKREEGINLNPPINSKNDFYNLYEIENLSFSYFLSNIIRMVNGELEDRDWFLFPIQDTKETMRIKTINLV